MCEDLVRSVRMLLQILFRIAATAPFRMNLQILACGHAFARNGNVAMHDATHFFAAVSRPGAGNAEIRFALFARICRPVS